MKCRFDDSENYLHATNDCHNLSSVLIIGDTDVVKYCIMFKEVIIILCHLDWEQNKAGSKYNVVLTSG